MEMRSREFKIQQSIRIHSQMLLHLQLQTYLENVLGVLSARNLPNVLREELIGSK